MKNKFKLEPNRDSWTESLSQLTPAKLKGWLPAIMLFLVVGLGVMIGLIPQVKDIAQIRLETAKLEKKLLGLEKKMATLTSLSEADLNSRVYLAEAALPSDKPIFQAVDMIQRQAGQYGLTVDAFDFSPGSVASESAETQKLPGSIQSVDMETTLMGRFESLLEFIKSIESSGPLTDVRGFSVSSAKLDSGEVKTTMILKIYYQPAPAKLPLVTEPLVQITDAQMAALEKLKTYSLVGPASFVPSANPTPRENPFVL